MLLTQLLIRVLTSFSGLSSATKKDKCIFASFILRSIKR